MPSIDNNPSLFRIMATALLARLQSLVRRCESPRSSALICRDARVTGWRGGHASSERQTLSNSASVIWKVSQSSSESRDWLR
ncbi:hypothetical protein [Paractinoplanes rishiriensis]|uniref:hypothetical protein n=1 Tax=Paractinoplanes rishiriensis TaxID=1050105 RepID=UPI00194179E8|nr:hypothetical protein [Actinoplanes rishiriensis]